jgi:hypothetical protein
MYLWEQNPYLGRISFFNFKFIYIVKKSISFLTAALCIVCLSGCQAIGDIFKAGVWVGVLIVLAVLALIIFLVTKSSNKG